MIKVSEISDNDLRDRVEQIISTIPTISKWQDYEVLTLALEGGKKDVAHYLLNHGCTVNRFTKNFVNTPLHYAVNLGDIVLVDKLLEKGALVTAVNADGNSPLHLAFLLNHIEIVDRLLANIHKTLSYTNVTNKYGIAHVHIACARGNAQVTYEFHYTGTDCECTVSATSPIYPNFDCLRFACESKSIETLEVLQSAILPMVDCLNDVSGIQTFLTEQTRTYNALIREHHLEYPVSPNIRLSDFQGVCFNGVAEAVKRFLELGRDPNTIMTKYAHFVPYYTPLHFAIEADENREEMVEMLLAYGADVTLKNGFCMTAIHLALYNDRRKNLTDSKIKCPREDQVLRMVYEALNDKEANPCDIFGVTYFHVAIALNEKEAVIKFLERGDAQCKPILPNRRNFSKYIPLHFAAKYGHEDIARLFIERGDNVNANDYETQFDTPLQVAIENGQYKMAKFLLEKGANAKVIRYKRKTTTLHLLVERYGLYEDEKFGLLGLVKTLIQYGADINARDEKWNTPLHRACDDLDNKIDMVYELLEWGADINISNWILETPLDVANERANNYNYQYFYKLVDHVMKLKDLGVKFDFKIDNFCHILECKREQLKVGDSWHIYKDLCSDEVLSFKYTERFREMERMRADRIDENVSLYDFVKMDVQQAASYMNAKRIKELISTENYKNYRYYGYLVPVLYHRIIQWLTGQNPKKPIYIQEVPAVIKRPLFCPKSSNAITISNATYQKLPANATLHEVISLGNIKRVKEMLAEGASLKNVNSKKNSPLHLAFILKYEEIVDLILSYMLDNVTKIVNLTNNYGLTHLHIAAARGNSCVVQKLLFAGAEPGDFINDNSPIYPGYTALNFACEAKSVPTVRLLTSALNIFKEHVGDVVSDEIPDVFTKISTRISLFHSVCYSGSVKKLDKFLERGEAVNATTSRESKLNPLYTGLHFAVQSAREHSCDTDYLTERRRKVESLLRHGADIGLRDGFCTTPLHLAFYVERGKHMVEKYSIWQETVNLLYEAAKNKEENLMDACGLTYLHIAAALNDLCLVKRLLFLGNDVNSRILLNPRGFSGYTPLHFAAAFGKPMMVKLLIERGANVNANEDDLHYDTPLQVAIVEGHITVAKMLLDYGANAKVVRPDDKKTMIHLLLYTTDLTASCDDKDVLIQKLLEHGADINAKDEDSLTVLHMACFKLNNHYLLMDWLLLNGADINIEDKSGATPLDYARRASFQENYQDFNHLYHHVQKLKDLGLWIHKNNDDFCEYILGIQKMWLDYIKNEHEQLTIKLLFSDSKLALRRQERLEEISMLVEDMLTDNVSLCDYLRMSPEEASNYVDNERIQFIINSGDHRDLYDNYGFLIPTQYRKSLKYLKNRQSLDNENEKECKEKTSRSRKRGRRRSSRKTDP